MRSAYIERNTKETKIQLSLNLDGQGKADIDSGIGFFDHMMNLLAFHSGMDISLRAQGDLDVAKGIRRHKKVDNAFIEDEFEKVKSLYRLDSISKTTSVDTPLPMESKLLLGSLVFAWICIIVVIFLRKRNKREI